MNISTFEIVNVVVTIVLICLFFGLAKRVVRNSQRKEQDILPMAAMSISPFYP
jgi:hypothetical protein